MNLKKGNETTLRGILKGIESTGGHILSVSRDRVEVSISQGSLLDNPRKFAIAAKALKDGFDIDLIHVDDL